MQIPSRFLAISAIFALVFLTCISYEVSRLTKRIAEVEGVAADSQHLAKVANSEIEELRSTVEELQSEIENLQNQR
jgi:cell division protein FtsB